ncbi:hypothetical protein CWB58_09830 [Pseudoalteromonas sp. S201]|uniref:tyrosine-type recombinase/integrase n=1 Tax=Pseudoalteromonas sp. S201 TaxID=579519 RepID=UPI00110CF695|nr:tyrosine-type recombinase/integrase [Pseudoalteromonas sp. S201]TMS93316.1 hypothetical protein CWB58_09830 [Pseudoalteromonas sp. S201]
MAESTRVDNYNYSSRVLNFHFVLDDEGIPIFAPSMFLFTLAIEGQSWHTTKNYSYDLAKFFTVLEQSKNADGGLGMDYREVTDSQMTGYLHGYLKQKLKLADTTISRHVAALSGFYTFAFQYGLLTSPPQFTYEYGDETTKTTLMEGLTIKLHQTYFDEVTFKKVVLANIPTKDPFLQERDRLALMLGYHAGFRTEELTIENNLDVSKLRKLLPKEENRIPRAMKLQVLGKNGVERGVQLTVAGTNAIYDFLWGRAKHIKTNLMCTKSGKKLTDSDYGGNLFRDCINAFLAKIRVTNEEYESWTLRTYHTLRKCYATNAVVFCYNNGLDPKIFVTQWMGHSDPSTTEIYIFYDAVLNKRLEISQNLDLQNTVFSQLYGRKFKKEAK